MRLRHLIRAPWVQNLLAYLLTLYLKLVYYTSRWTFEGFHHPEQFIGSNKPFIACFWHGRMAMIPFMWRWKFPITALVSLHADGQLVGRTFKHFGIDYTLGSTSRGGTRALRDIVHRLKNGEVIGLTPDGPRGPRQVASPGIIAMAKLTRTPIIPISYATSRFIELKTWDRFHVPLPFSKGVLVFGTPLPPPEDNDWENYRLRVEQAITNLQTYADQLCGRL